MRITESSPSSPASAGMAYPLEEFAGAKLETLTPASPEVTRFSRQARAPDPSAGRVVLAGVAAGRHTGGHGAGHGARGGVDDRGPACLAVALPSRGGRARDVGAAGGTRVRAGRRDP